MPLSRIAETLLADLAAQTGDTPVLTVSLKKDNAMRAQ
jgi:hypothetical protein